MSTVWLVWCYREDAREWWLLAVAADREQAVRLARADAQDTINAYLSESTKFKWAVLEVPLGGRFDVDLDTILGGAESVDVTTKGEALF